MDSRLKILCEELGKMSSSQAADWLMTNYPVDKADYGDAITMLSHRSWKRPDQIRLAQHYLKKMPFASSKVYEAFASFMSFELFLKSINEQVPTDKSDIDLLLYYLLPVLEKSARSDVDRELVKSFIADVR